MVVQVVIWTQFVINGQYRVCEFLEAELGQLVRYWWGVNFLPSHQSFMFYSLQLPPMTSNDLIGTLDDLTSMDHSFSYYFFRSVSSLVHGWHPCLSLGFSCWGIRSVPIIPSEWLAPVVPSEWCVPVNHSRWLVPDVQVICHCHLCCIRPNIWLEPCVSTGRSRPDIPMWERCYSSIWSVGTLRPRVRLVLLSCCSTQYEVGACCTDVNSVPLTRYLSQ